MQKIELLVKFLFRLPAFLFFLVIGIGFGLYIGYEFRGRTIEEEYKSFERSLSDVEFDFQDVISFTFWLWLVNMTLL